MLALPKSSNITFLDISAGAALLFFVISIIICVILVIRRFYRNNKKNNELKEKIHFEKIINAALKSDLKNLSRSQFNVKNKPVLNEVILRYFRMLDGEPANALRNILNFLDFEPQIRASTQVDTLGRRMEAMQILSYLDTQSSLICIHDGLFSSKKYIRLTAARCLSRRQANVFLDDIVTSINSAFPSDPQILSDILYSFGSSATSQLESYIQDSQNDNIIAACLEAMVLLMPPKTSLDLSQLMDSANENVRAATVSLSAVTAHKSKDDILIKALADTATKVKIRASKIAYKSKRSDTISLLFKLSKDPLLWVRYWSIKAIWNSGRQGRKLVGTMARGNDATARMAHEVSLEGSYDQQEVIS